MDHIDAGAATGYDGQRFGLLMIDEGSEANVSTRRKRSRTQLLLPARTRLQEIDALERDADAAD